MLPAAAEILGKSAVAALRGHTRKNVRIVLICYKLVI